MRGFAAIAAVITSVLLAAASRGVTGGAMAPEASCTPAVWLFEDQVRAATFILIADVVSVGDGTNRAPTPTRDPAATPEALPTTPPLPLAGVGASVRPIRVLAGYYSPWTDMPPQFAIDADERQAIEMRNRLREIGDADDCGIVPPVYEPGRRYLIFLGPSYPDDAYDRTLIRVPLDGTTMRFEGSAATMDRSLQERFLPESTAVPVEGARAYVNVRFVDMSLYRFLRFVSFVRDDPSIAPPETGSAGLAAAR